MGWPWHHELKRAHWVLQSRLRPVYPKATNTEGLLCMIHGSYKYPKTNQWEGPRVFLRTTAVKGRVKESQKLCHGVIGTHVVLFCMSVNRMVCLPLIPSSLCLGDSISEDLPASSACAQKWKEDVIKIIRSFLGRDYVFLSCDHGHLTIWNVNKSFHVMGSSWAPGAAMAVRFHRSDGKDWW